MTRFFLIYNTDDGMIADLKRYFPAMYHTSQTAAKKQMDEVAETDYIKEKLRRLELYCNELLKERQYRDKLKVVRELINKGAYFQAIDDPNSKTRGRLPEDNVDQQKPGLKRSPSRSPSPAGSGSYELANNPTSGRSYSQREPTLQPGSQLKIPEDNYRATSPNPRRQHNTPFVPKTPEERAAMQFSDPNAYTKAAQSHRRGGRGRGRR